MSDLQLYLLSYDAFYRAVEKLATYPMSDTIQ